MYFAITLSKQCCVNTSFARDSDGSDSFVVWCYAHDEGTDVSCMRTSYRDKKYLLKYHDELDGGRYDVLNSRTIMILENVKAL